MSSLSACEAIQALFQDDTDISAALTGGIWTRRIMPNVSTTNVPTPGSTPEAFDDHKRVLPCMSVVPLPESRQLGNTYLGGVELVMWCLPHTSEKHVIESVIILVKETYDGKVVVGEGIPQFIRIAGRVGFNDDPEIPNSVVDRLLVQLDYTREK